MVHSHPHIAGLCLSSQKKTLNTTRAPFLHCSGENLDANELKKNIWNLCQGAYLEDCPSLWHPSMTRLNRGTQNSKNSSSHNSSVENYTKWKESNIGDTPIFHWTMTVEVKNFGFLGRWVKSLQRDRENFIDDIRLFELAQLPQEWDVKFKNLKLHFSSTSQKKMCSKSPQSFTQTKNKQSVILGCFKQNSKTSWLYSSRSLKRKKVPSLKLTAISHLKIDLWKRRFRTWKPPFSGAKMFVSGRVPRSKFLPHHLSSAVPCGQTGRPANRGARNRKKMKNSPPLPNISKRLLLQEVCFFTYANL